jgi:alpha-tubulin suppressor-like RCC1 family protein
MHRGTRSLTSADKSLRPGATSGDGADTGLTILLTPAGDGHVAVMVNGMQQVLSDGDPANWYFNALNAAESNALALRFNGTAWAWGYNVTGNLGNNSTTGRSSPVSVVGDHSFTQLHGYGGVIALKVDGTAWGWGYNQFGAVGDNSTSNRSSPVSVVGGHSFLAVASEQGLNSIGLKADGSAWTWGWNNYGQLGNNSTTDRSSPVSVVGGHAFVEITDTVNGNDSFARKADGSVWAWGNNFLGKLGDNSTTDRSSPVSVVGGHSFVEIDDGMGRKADGTAWTWGDGGNGSIGQGTIAVDRSSPVSVAGNHSFTQVTAGYSIFRMGLKADGSAWAWGGNDSGNLGDNTTTNRSSPVSVVGGHSFTAIDGGGPSVSMGLKADGTIWAWGDNQYGQLGSNSTANRSSPVSVLGGPITGDCYFGVLDPAASFSAINGNGLAIRSDGTLWSWGVNNIGQVGDGVTINRSSPVSVIGNHVFAFVIGGSDHVVARKSDGTAWTWGEGEYGGIGNNSTAHRSSPVSVVGDHSFSKVAAGTLNNAGIKADGTTWAWGFNGEGQLGNNSTDNRSSPVSVVGNHSFASIGGGNELIALKSDGTAWAWGANQFGSLGNNSTTDRSSPVSVVGGHSFTVIATGGYTEYGLALKADGSAWVWGNNFAGELGDNTTANRSSPVSVVGGHSFVEVDIGLRSSYGRKADGTVWSWGYNNGGELGDNSTSRRSSPVSIVGGHSFVEIGAGTQQGFARKSDGTLWAWGGNDSGNLGDNTTTNRSSPVSVITTTTTMRYIGDITTGDYLFWNGDTAGFDLASTDRVDLDYIA